MKKNRNENKKRRGIGVFLNVVIMLACVFPLLVLDSFPTAELINRIGLLAAEAYVIAVMIVSFIVSVMVHEAGHLVFGLMSGYGFCSYRIFNIIWLKTDDGIKVKKYSPFLHFG